MNQYIICHVHDPQLTASIGWYLVAYMYEGSLDEEFKFSRFLGYQLHSVYNLPYTCIYLIKEFDNVVFFPG